MYVRKLHIQNLKLLRDFKLDFVDAAGNPRMWTVLIGENGTCKTSILQAIALAASGPARASALADMASLPDKRRPNEQVVIAAVFGFSPSANPRRSFPALSKPLTDSPPDVYSALLLRPDRTDFTGLSHYLGEESGNPLLDRMIGARSVKPPSTSGDVETPPQEFSPFDFLLGMFLQAPHISSLGGPIDEARSGKATGWFVAGYGCDRSLSPPSASISLPPDFTTLRLGPLFGKSKVLGANFGDLFALHLKDLAPDYLRVLRQLLVEGELLPRVDAIDLRNRADGGNPARLVEAHQVDLHVGNSSVRLPLVWLSQGYQAMFAWAADLVGQMFLEAGGAIEASAMEGIVLLDELDLHLHPMWQRHAVRALKKVFPRIQFIATTHSPMVLPYLHQDEVFILDSDEDGNIVPKPAPESPALLTSSGIYAKFFGLTEVFPREIGDKLWRYSYIAADPSRSDEEEDEAQRLRHELIATGIDPGPEPVAREAVK